MRNRLDQILRGFLVWLLALMVLNVLWQVASRYLLNSPSSFTDELARYLLIWMGLLGSAYFTGQNQNLALDILQAKLSPSYRANLQKFIHGLVFLFCFSVLVIGGSRLVYISFQLGQLSSALRLPLGVVYLVIPISGFLISFYSVSGMFAPKKK